MGFRFRKSINLGGGLRLNLSKSGVGYSWGTKGFRITKTADGTVRKTASIPGTGLSYVTESSKKQPETVTDNISAGETKSKKPFYQKGWYWAIIILFVLIGIGGSGENDKDSVSSTETTTEAQAEQTTTEEPTVPATTESTTETSAEPTTSETSSETPTESASSQVTEAPSEPTTTAETKVYITPTGSKYHYNNNCNGGTYIESSLDEALAKGLEPCKRCVK